MSHREELETGRRGKRARMPEWYRRLAAFQKSSWGAAIGQIANSFLPFLALAALITHAVLAGWPYWIALLLSVAAAGFLVRIFIIFHDCTHGSFLPTKRANRIVGFLSGVFVFTPFEPWRLSHLAHHGSAGNLDRRGVGDVATMTLAEYENASRWQRLKYRLYRHPFIMFVVGSPYVFVFLHRFTGLRGTKAERRSVIATNLCMAAMAAGYIAIFGLRTWALVQLPIISLAGVAGIWLFYVQHQFDPGYWAREEEWDQIKAALHGSSYYKLPKVLQWFSGNIGIHHIHHLRPRIPNYRLQRAYDHTPETHLEKPLTLWKSLGSIRYNLWSEMHQRFMSFRDASRVIRARTRGERPVNPS
ncbi:MAG: fatty acid desaturase [Spirochaetota bacterium]